jgi:predicted branched-subunit amino acid permease
MTTTSDQSAYMTGMIHAVPFLLVIAPFSLLFGVVATEAGLDLLQTMGFSTLVIAGAAQFAALQMMIDGATVPLILMAALAVNLRMAMYSAALVPHLGSLPLWQRALIAYVNFDQTYATSVARYEARPEMTARQKGAYFLGVATPITPAWYLFTLTGALIGSTIPPALALDFALPITFVAMMAPMLRTLAHVAAALTSVIVALALSGLPSGTGLLIAAFCAMCAGALVETLTTRARP